jgi:drug/metabolite transporter (DMT)-like permease
LGIDFLLGAKLDRKANNVEAMFLPEKLMQGMTLAQQGSKVLTTAPMPLVTINQTPVKKGWFTPFLFFAIVAGLYVAVTFSGRRNLIRRMDRTLFFLAGLCGLLLLFMWFFTDHPICANNYNLLWANPLLLPAAFLVKKESGTIRRYFLVVFCFLAIALIGWPLLPQNMNEGFLPLLILLAYRLSGYAKIFGNGRKNSEAIGRRNLSANAW